MVHEGCHNGNSVVNDDSNAAGVDLMEQVLTLIRIETGDRDRMTTFIATAGESVGVETKGIERLGDGLLLGGVGAGAAHSSTATMRSRTSP
jgi:hypothetical protein